MQALSHTELAWAAGFFDGEGSTSYSNGKTLPCVTIGQADPFVLGRFKHAIGNRGNVSGPFKRKNNPTWKDQWNYRSGKFEDVQFIIASLWKWLSPLKQKQAARVLLAYKTLCRDKPSMKRGQLVCKRGHDLSVAGSVGIKSDGTGRFCNECAKSCWRSRDRRA